MEVQKTLMMAGLAVAMLSGSCSKKNSAGDTTQPANGSIAASIYPLPPSQWMQASGTTYYSAGWVGDVMPYYDQGKFHVFYLHDARDGQAGFHPIHKFETADLVNYSYQGLMINYAGREDQDLAIGTGSVVKVGDTYYCYYTGHNYLFPASSKPKEGVMYATSKDLKTWTKKAGFNLTAPTGYDRNEFRDPQVFYNNEKKEYWMLVSTRTGNKAVVALFATQDPATDNWTLRAPLFTTDNEAYFMLECADVFQWGDKWYLFFSENNQERTTHYRVGTSSSGPWIKPARDVIDGEYFYAAKTASDGTNRYAFGWTATKGNKADGGNKEWAGNLVVHQLKQQSDGSLTVQAPVTVDALLKQEKTLTKAAGSGEVVQTGADYAVKQNASILFDRISGQKKITTTVSNVQPGSEFGFVFGAATTTSDSYYHLSIREADDRSSVVRLAGAGQVVESQVPISIETGKEYQLTIVIDNTVCVLYLNEQVALSTRIYSLPNAHWGLFSSHGNVLFKNLKLFSH